MKLKFRTMKLCSSNGVTVTPYDRFSLLSSPYDCPQCHGIVFCDSWPPNYSGGYSNGTISSFGGSMKCICEECKITFRIDTWSIQEIDKPRNEGFRYDDIVPLVEKDGLWLTPTDVCDEEYKEKHGEYRKHSYA